MKDPLTQFPHLLAEIHKAGIPRETILKVAGNMGLSVLTIYSLFEEAVKADKDYKIQPPVLVPESAHNYKLVNLKGAWITVDPPSEGHYPYGVKISANEEGVQVSIWEEDIGGCDEPDASCSVPWNAIDSDEDD